jgi:TP901 family phage tail tape measure protein
LGGGIAADLLVHVGADTRDAVDGLDNVGNKVDNTGQKFQIAGGIMMGASAGLVGGLGFAIGSAMNFEGAMNDVQASLGLNATEMGSVKDLALEIGKATTLSGTEAAKGIEELGKAGVSTKDILGGVGLATANLASAVGTDMSTAATAVSTVMTVWGKSGADAVGISDTITAAVNTSRADIQDIQLGIANAGVTASAVGMTFEQTAAAIAMFSAAGVDGARAGTQLNTAIGMLVNPTADASTEMQKLGINMDEGIASGDLMGYLAGKLSTGLGGLSKAEQEAALYTMFGSDAQQIMNILMKEGTDGVKENQKAMESHGQAATAAKARMAGLRGAVENLKGSFETAMIVLGSTFLPILNHLASGITRIVNGFLGLNPKLQQFIGFAIAGVAGVLAFAGGFSLLIGFIGPIVAGLMALAIPFILIGALLVGLYMAWQSNFGGIQDIVMPIIDGIVNGFTLLAQYLYLAATATGEAGKMFDQLPGWLQPIAGFLGVVADAAQQLYNAFSKDGLGGVMDALPAQLDRVGAAFLRMGEVILTNIKNLDWGAIGSALLAGMEAAASMIGDAAGWLLDKLGDLAGALGSWLWAQASAVDWAGLLSTAAGMAGDIAGTIVSKLGDLLGALGTWLYSQAIQVPWASLLSTAAGLAGDITSTIVSKLGDLTKSLGDWLIAQAGVVDWAGILSSAASAAGDITGDIVKKLGNLAQALSLWLVMAGIGLPWSSIINGVTDITGDIVKKLGDLALGLKDWYDNAINGVAWGDLGVTVGEKVGSLAAVLVPKAGEMIQGFLTAIVNPGLWEGIAIAIGALILALPATIAYLGLTLGPKALEFLQGFAEGIGLNWPVIGDALTALPGLLLSYVPDLSTTLLDKGLQLLTGLWTGATQAYDSVIVPGVQGLVTFLLNSFTSAPTWLLAAGTAILAGLWLGATAAYDGIIVPGVQGLITFLISSFTSAASWLPGAGSALLNGLWNGARAVYDGVIVPGVQGLIAFVLSSFASAGSWLPSAGTALLNGLWTAANAVYTGSIVPGFQAIVTFILTTFNGAASWLVGAGADILGGLLNGIQSIEGSITGELQSIVSGILTSFSGAGDWLVSAGASIFNGLLSGINSSGQAALDAASAWAKSIMDAVVGWIKPGSPSKVSTPWGAAIMDGLGLGITNAGPEAVAAANEFSKAVMRAAMVDIQPISASAFNTSGDNATAVVRSVNQSGTALAGIQGQGGGQSIVQNITVNVKLDELEDMVRAGAFVRDLNTTRRLYVSGVS